MNWCLLLGYNEQELTLVKNLTKADLQYFIFTFIKHQFKRTNILRIESLVEELINHLVFI